LSTVHTEPEPLTVMSPLSPSATDAAAAAAVTKAVEAICVVLVPGEAVGVAGVPVSVGLAMFAFNAKSVPSAIVPLRSWNV